MRRGWRRRLHQGSGLEVQLGYEDVEYTTEVLAVACELASCIGLPEVRPCRGGGGDIKPGTDYVSDNGCRNTAMRVCNSLCEEHNTNRCSGCAHWY